MMQLTLSRLKLIAGVAFGFAAGLAGGLMPPARASSNQAVPAELDFGGQAVRLGSPKGDLIARLSKDFGVEESGDPAQRGESWFVTNKNDPLSMVGSLRFRNGALIYAIRDWGNLQPVDDKSMAFLKAVYGAVERVFGNGKSGVVKCTLKRDPGQEILQIDLVSPSHSVVLGFFETSRASGGFRRMAVVEESLEK